MNEQLKFSWGHIIAFVALIFIAYVTFMGITYYTLGNFTIAVIGSVISVMLLSITILGAQVKKGSPNKFYKSIIWERCLLLASPIILLLVFIPYNHFWSVLSQDEEIVRNFNLSLEKARGIFTDYETYSNNRIETLSQNLSKYPVEMRNNRVEELQLLLLSDNYTKLKTEANLWIDNASKNSSVWNVFLLGNVDKIIAAVNNWSNDLNFVSKKRLSSENYFVEDFSSDSQSKYQAEIGLDYLKEQYSNSDFNFNSMSIVTIVICYIMLLFPYFIQERHAANCERFWDFSAFSTFYDSDLENENPLEPDYNMTTIDKPINKTGEIQETNTTIKTGKGAPV